MKLKITALVIITIFVSACNRYIKTNESVVDSSGDNSEFSVLTVPPSEPYKELGVINFLVPTKVTTDPSFKRSMKKDVCQNGGNAVLLVAPNESGKFTSGAVLLVSY